MRFMVAASRPISSSASGCGTRRCSCAAEISSTSRRIASTGARARPTANQVVTATTTTSTGSPMISSRGDDRGGVEHVDQRPGHHDDPLARRTVWAPSATAMNSSLSSGVITCADSPGRQSRHCGFAGDVRA